MSERVLGPLATAHSHAFQRALRGRTHELARTADFWSWRALMYRFAAGVDPDAMYDLARFAFEELAANGVTAVGEFHYVHHGPDGAPYDDRIAMADRVVRAARDAGLRITLLRVLYARGGWRRALDPVQRRFADEDVDVGLADADAIAARFADDPGVAVGLAPHSVRAVPPRWLEAARDHAEARGWPLHMHVAEQPREIQECLAEHGRRPVSLLAELGLLGPRFTAVHATHLRPAEARALGAARAFACICRTTERDLGDGAPDLEGLVRAGARLCAGVDSHAISDPFVELRAMELDERARLGRRQVVLDGSGLAAAARAGYDAIGQDPGDDAVFLDDEALAVTGVEGDGVYFAATGAAVTARRVLGRRIDPDSGQRARIRQRYLDTLARLTA